jgi:hypothetical protein
MLDELKSLVGDLPLLPFNGTEGRQLVRLALPGGLYLEATPEYALEQVKGGLLEDARRLARQAHFRGGRLLPASWAGPKATYRCVMPDGTYAPLRVVGGGPEVVLARPSGNDVARLLAKASMFSIRLEPVSERRGEVIYRGLQPDGKWFMGTAAKLAALLNSLESENPSGNGVVPQDPSPETLPEGPNAKHVLAQRGAQAEPGYQLVPSLREGPSIPDAEGLTAANAALEQASRTIGLHLLPDMQAQGRRNLRRVQCAWTLPDGTIITASWVELKAALATVLGAPKSGRPPRPLTFGFSRELSEALRGAKARKKS